MKYIFTFLIALSFVCTAQAGNDKFQEAMEKALTEMDSAKSSEDLQKVANKLERIAKAEPKEWLPNYYVSLNYCYMAFMGEGKIEIVDPMLDKAQEFLDLAKEIKKVDMAEIYCLQSLIYSGRIGVDPQTRGMKYGPMTGMVLEKAKKVDENNPRVWYLLGQNTFYTPAQWGGGVDRAMPMLEKAMELYETVEPKSTIHPDWGMDRCQQILAQAKAQPAEK